MAAGIVGRSGGSPGNIRDPSTLNEPKKKPHDDSGDGGDTKPPPEDGQDSIDTP